VNDFFGFFWSSSAPFFRPVEHLNVAGLPLNVVSKISAPLLSSLGRTYLSTFKFNTTYTFDQTYGVTFAYNKTTGSTHPELYSNYSLARPNSEFYSLELVYVPFGKSDTHLYMLNLRTSLQYIAYSEFNGTSNQASANNTFMLNGVLAF
jgi:hypothetical protein